MTIALHTTLPSKSRLKQIDSLQVLRALAVTQVAWAHAGQWLSERDGRWLPDFGVFGIDIFFVISGFIMSSIVLKITRQHGREASWDFLQRRLTRIFPIYWILAALVLFRHLLSEGFHLPNYWPTFFLLPSPQFYNWNFLIHASWTLVFEMFFYYVLAVILLFTVRKAVFLAIGLLVGSVMLGRIVGIKEPWLVVICNPILLEFVFGTIIGLLYQRFGLRKRAGIALLGLGAVLALCLQARPPLVADGMKMVLQDDMVFRRVFTWGMAAALIVAGSVFWSPTGQHKLWRLAVVLGNSSYSAYLASALVIEFTLRGLLHLRRAFTLPGHVLYQITMVAMVLFVGWLSYQFVEWPLVRGLQARFNRGEKPRLSEMVGREGLEPPTSSV
jgi:exopolysaccharide production protein ExoZ